MNPKRAIPDEDAGLVRELAAAGQSDRKIGLLYGCGKYAVQSFRRRHGISTSYATPKLKLVILPKPKPVQWMPPQPIFTYEEDGHTVRRFRPWVSGLMPDDSRLEAEEEEEEKIEIRSGESSEAEMQGLPAL